MGGAQRPLQQVRPLDCLTPTKPRHSALVCGRLQSLLPTASLCEFPSTSALHCQHSSASRQPETALACLASPLIAIPELLPSASSHHVLLVRNTDRPRLPSRCTPLLPQPHSQSPLSQ
jgi:hypothetical protein